MSVLTGPRESMLSSVLPPADERLGMLRSRYPNLGILRLPDGRWVAVAGRYARVEAAGAAELHDAIETTVERVLDLFG